MEFYNFHVETAAQVPMGSHYRDFPFNGIFKKKSMNKFSQMTVKNQVTVWGNECEVFMRLYLVHVKRHEGDWSGVTYMR